MEQWKCTICGYIYNPETGDPEGDIPAGTSFESLPDDWMCPVCGAGKKDFAKV
jgi:rubredoxin